GKAILYADVMTDSMEKAISETNRRRQAQLRYNEENHITPETILKPIDMSLVGVAEADYWTPPEAEAELEKFATAAERDAYIARLEKEMREAAARFEFERAAGLRDRIRALKQSEVLA
ncbi:MAG: UvrB/UvrC motif-containing protein, partial [Acidobacteria bacterium]|nr:UvrB/UvrC motif-containing protein [Acidobacteriota bacterium]